MNPLHTKPILGPLMVDVAGTELAAEDRDILQHPLVGGLILFARNTEAPEQIAALTAHIRRLRPDLLIAVDQEGGRVQRMRSGFVRLPALGCLGVALQEQGPDKASAVATELAWLMAAEVRAMDIDISFAPVLDLDYGVSTVIGDRAAAAKVDDVVMLVTSYLAGMRQAGMAATAKHFPGHGAVAADSHLELPVDERELAQIHATDMQPFAQLAHHYQAVMMAHVLYPQVDERYSAGFSHRWVQELLPSVGFDGAVFSDDLRMQGAAAFGDPVERARLALAAGCHMLPLCNDRLAVEQVLDAGLPALSSQAGLRLAAMRGGACTGWQALQQDSRWRQAAAMAEHYCELMASV